MDRKTIVTHNSTFHADDVFAVAAYVLAHGGRDAWNIVRTRDAALIAPADAVVDVGGEYDATRQRFDHHQKGGAGVRDNGLPYAAFGLVWKEVGEKLCGSKEVAEQVDARLAAPNDTTDNGVTIATPCFEDVTEYALSDYVHSFNLTWREEGELGANADARRDEIFSDLVDWASALLLRQIKRSTDKVDAVRFVQAAYDAAEDKRVIMLDRYYPWQSVITEYPEPLFVVFPDQQGSRWSMKAVPVEGEDFKNRKDLPADWAGKTDAELAAATGVADAVFCHSGRFFAVAGSKEGILELVRKALEA